MSNRKKTSPVWNYFTQIDTYIALCNICKVKISYRSSTTNLKKHLTRKHPAAITVPGNQKISTVSQDNTKKAFEEMVLECTNLDDEVGQDPLEMNGTGTEIEIASSVDELESEIQGENSSNNSKLKSPRVDKVFAGNQKVIWQLLKPNTLSKHNQKISQTCQQQQPSNKGDSYDSFGRYIASLLREVGPPASLALQEEITSLILHKVCVLNS